MNGICVRQFFTGKVYVSTDAILLSILISMVILLSTTVKCQKEMRPFPPLFNAAQNRPVYTDPSDITCGVPIKNAYCKSSTFPISVQQCAQDFCSQTCPSRTVLPEAKELAKGITPGFEQCVMTDTRNTHPGSHLGEYSTYFLAEGPNCFLTPSYTPNIGEGGAFTMTVWIWQQKFNGGTIFQKITAQSGELIIELQLKDSKIHMFYRSVDGLANVYLDHIIPAETWTHVAIQVYGTTLSFFVNGLKSGYSAHQTLSLVSSVQDKIGIIRVGQNFQGGEQFLGRLQEFKFFEVTLSNREIDEVYSGILTELRIQTLCRCPPLYPRVDPLQTHYCIKNGDADNTDTNFMRLNEQAHPLEYINDGDSSTIWISKFQEAINITVELGDDFQVFYVVLQFYSPLPKGVLIERQRDANSAWETWQMYAEDCNDTYGVEDNGPLPLSTSVNCIQLLLDTRMAPYSKGNITFNILSPQPVLRPGYNDFYNTPELFDFVMAYKVRISLEQHFYVTELSHTYYGIYDFIITGRCECHGHSDSCEMSTLPYSCNCSEESRTEGERCEMCLPLYNNKPFHRGDQLNGYSCKYCECYGHATSCTYNKMLDPFPNNHKTGGGGVCVNCQDFTEGQFCDMCMEFYYRPIGKSKYDVDVCSPCICYADGVLSNNMDCEKEGGQCPCKERVTGRQCDLCIRGYFNLQPDNSLGCESCSCTLSGTMNADISCHPKNGECYCKANVRNVICDQCEFGYFNLSAGNPLGCTPCNCNPLGSVNQFCDAVTGICECRAHITGRECDLCADDYYNFDGGCLRCSCSKKGTVPGSFCDKGTGQCMCKEFVAGLSCDICKDGAYGYALSAITGCLECSCIAEGTFNSSSACEKQTGDCVCKDNVMGSNCNQCKSGFWGLSAELEEGCQPCDCDVTGTQNNEACKQTSGNCSCLTNRIGRRCEDCDRGFYVNDVELGGCIPCDCTRGAIPLTACDSQSGQCQCNIQNGVTGRDCSHCDFGFYNYDKWDGRCKSCDCDLAGSLNTSFCGPVTGQCACKKLVQGLKCDRCKEHTSYLDRDNSYGCSKEPDQQPPPTYQPLGPNALRLHWDDPDSPNGVIQQYNLYRNGTFIYGQDPNVKWYDDIDLQAYSYYTYVIEAVNAHGGVNSTPVTFQTPAGIPSGSVFLTVDDITARGGFFTWNNPDNMHGPLDHYELVSITTSRPVDVVHWTGHSSSVTLINLVPFTNHTIRVRVCTESGCLDSSPTIFSTLSAEPEGMLPPVVTIVSSTKFKVTWSPPTEPNGIIIFYELWMRGLEGPDGIRAPQSSRIFHPSGQYNPRPTFAPQENALVPPNTEYNVEELETFTVYEFLVLAENDAGKVSSSWMMTRSGEALPLFIAPPVMIGAAGGFDLNITWSEPAEIERKGVILEYNIYTKNDKSLQFDPSFIWQKIYSGPRGVLSYLHEDLEPYLERFYILEACNSIGCINSTQTPGRTLQAIPEDLDKPQVEGFNSTAMMVKWAPPGLLNGPEPIYTLEKTTPALSYTPQVERGTRFPGGGYYLFPPETLPKNVLFTGIRFWFKTKQENGLILFASSEGLMEEFTVIQLGVGRPRIIFDTQGCPSFATPTNDEGLSYNDNRWHQLSALRVAKTAYINIDDFWSGDSVARNSDCRGNLNNLIGPNTGVYIGGLPTDFEFKREFGKTDARLEVTRQAFQGCMRDIEILQQMEPFEVWKKVKWEDAITNELAFLNWEGCPVNLDIGIHFLGHGYVRLPPAKINFRNRGSLSFSMRTEMHTGLIFFAYGGIGVYVYGGIDDGSLHFQFSNGIYSGLVVFEPPDANFCDGQWYDIVMEKDGQKATISVDGYTSGYQGTSTINVDVQTVSDFYIGGIPPGSDVEEFIKNNGIKIATKGFGGCIANFRNWREINFVTESIEVVNVNMDGCSPPSLTQAEETCKDSLITELYSGNNTQAFDDGLMPYTDYLYRVIASNDAGSAISQWGYGRTLEGAPVGVHAPHRFRVLSGYMVEVRWYAPDSTAGLLSKFVLRAFQVNDAAIPPVEALFLNTTKRIGNITDMVPHTNYLLKMMACTRSGCTESENGLPLLTHEEAPKDVPSPTAYPGPTFLVLHWDPPLKPNGIITGYFLYRDPVLIYTGGERTFNITDLQVYTAYNFSVRACTRIGCTDSQSALLSTAQLPPVFVDPPVLLALGTTRVEARWEEPEHLNGMIERYMLYLTENSNELGRLIYNNSDLFLNYVITELTAGTTYYVILAACTGGGCTLSEDSSSVLTEQSAPEGVLPPNMTSPSPTELDIIWEEPEYPNGNIVQYELFHNEVLIYRGLLMNYAVTGLAAYSLNSFRVAACTYIGCGSSELVQARTQEDTPHGIIVMQIKATDARSISVRWNAPEFPNGQMIYEVYFEGQFYADPEAWDYFTLPDRRNLYTSTDYGDWVQVTDLILMSQYNVQVNGSNTVGFILSNVLAADLPPGTPDGVKPPDLVSESPNSITAQWLPVGRTNAVEDPQFILQFRDQTVGGVVEDIFGPTTAFKYVKPNLRPFTFYDFRLVASNTHGFTTSDWESQITKQGSPMGFDPPLIIAVHSRSINMTWNPPLTPNGIVTHYNLFQNEILRESLSSNVTHLHADLLSPDTEYVFSFEACTIGGCTRSQNSTRIQTEADIPEGIAAPNVETLTPTSVEITWIGPVFPNGEITQYAIDRRENGSDNITEIATFLPTEYKAFIDDDPILSPHTEYEYRLRVINLGGEGKSPWVDVVMQSSRPAGVNPPSVNILGPTSMEIFWQPPLQPNGVLESYIIQLPDPRLEFKNTSYIESVVVNDLEPFTQYSITLTACTSAGCTESALIVVRTDGTIPDGQAPPVPTPILQHVISVLWQPPSKVNGPNIRYELSRMKIEQPLDPNGLDIDLWVSVHSGTATSFVDRGLPLFTTYIYRVSVYNDIGQFTSRGSMEVMTFGGFPREAADVTATTLDHVSILVEWITPSIISLQGEVTEYLVNAYGAAENWTEHILPATNEMVLTGLTPNTEYTVTVIVTINGGAAITSEPVRTITEDGAPKGVNAPIISIIDEFSLRVSWTAPQYPNGQVTGYNIYVNRDVIPTNETVPSSYIMTDLQPFTVYTVQIEVCTIFDCAKSAAVLATTAEALPSIVQPPQTVPLNSSTVQLSWVDPQKPNGIILRYVLWRRMMKPCSEVPIPTVDPELTKCSYVECGILENICGSTCYSGKKICCSGVVHDTEEGYGCCGTDYVPRQAEDDVCCIGKFYQLLENYQCCGSRYVEVLPGNICCPDLNEDRVLIGYGDRCCNSIPYSSSGAQICCAGTLHDRHRSQCCGNTVVTDASVCCGVSDGGVSYDGMTYFECCGTQYVDSRISLCCVSDTGHSKVHTYDSAVAKNSANQKCCGMKTISNRLSCCNYIGYNVMTHICADLSNQDAGCGQATVCAADGLGEAFCDRCDFDHSQNKCGSVTMVNPTPAPPTTPDPTDSCMVSDERIFSGMEYQHEDSGLDPDTVYAYAVMAVNKAGSRQSEFVTVTTLEAAPKMVLTPNSRVDPRQLHVIFLTWELPTTPNGEIIHFILTRDGLDLYKGLDVQFKDDTTIQPFKSYSYIITACTKAGCTSSDEEIVATAQNKPEHVIPPVVEYSNSNAMYITWYPPAKPNGIITQYSLLFVGDGFGRAYNTSSTLSMEVTGLKPFTEYNISLAVCTQAGCTRSANITTATDEAIPHGLKPPVVIIFSSSSVGIYWQPPESTNGEILFYNVTRKQEAVVKNMYTGMDFEFIDNGLMPSVSYVYSITAANTVGETTSESTTVNMPIKTPSNILSPRNVSVLSAYTIYVSWDPIVDPGGQIDQYRILINTGQDSEMNVGVELRTAFTLQHLSPFTVYEVRIIACLLGVPNGCGTGPGITVQTLEAPPEDMQPPILVPMASDTVEISWSPPIHPNGIITQYSIYYHKVRDTVKILINRVAGNVLDFSHAGQELLPFTDYEYQIVVANLEGEADSPWVTVRTLEAPPTGLRNPVVTTTGAFSMDVSWLPPVSPNGVIISYKLTYKLASFNPNIPGKISSVTLSETFNTTISGLEPYSSYQLKLGASNGAGNASSPWVDVHTLETSPTGLSDFSVEGIDTGRAVILTWQPPVRPNGLISSYRIYEASSEIAIYQDLHREFEFRHLLPFTTYSVQLEACTTGGCSRGSWQDFTTAEILPTDQPSPTVNDAGADYIVISWMKPANPNGEILLYEVLRRINLRIEKRSLTEPKVVFNTDDTSNDTFSFRDTSLDPFSEYHYSIRATNSQGTTESPWQSVFTMQAPPDGVLPPKVSHITDLTSGLHVTWETPSKANGIIWSYHLQRNESVPLSFTPDDPMEIDDTELNAFTLYSYTITVCSGGGCTESEPSTMRTRETAPLSMDPPVIEVLTSTSLKVTWQPPQITNGKIILYRLKMDDIVAFEGMSMDFTVEKLTPYQQYTFMVTACTEGGCTDGGEVSGRPDDDIPSDLQPPVLRILSSSSIEVSWKSPKNPNGVISSYDIRRDDKLVYTESLSINPVLLTMYTDFNLDPGTQYTYLTIARNRKGSVQSSPVSATTYSSSPSGLRAPVLTVLSSVSIQVTWTSPVKFNGPLKNYTLLKDGVVVYSGDPKQFNYTVQNLQVWTEYKFRVQACTDRGCILSKETEARTLESIPQNQGSPTVQALANEDGGHNGVLVSWVPPVQPNGVIVSYEVERRQVYLKETGPSYGDVVMVYNATQQQYTDQDPSVKPNSGYAYRVSAVNNAGKGTTSTWADVKTKEAPPDSVSPPAVSATSPNTITIIITPPSMVNGRVRYYNVLLNGTLTNSSPNLQQTLGDSAPLSPHKIYALQVEACTAGGCMTSPPIFVLTGSSKPSGLDPPVIIYKNSTSVTLGWNHPSESNGEILKFVLSKRTPCPQTLQPFSQYCEVGESETVYEGLFIEYTVTDLVPHTAYEFQIQAENSAGGVDVLIWVRVETNSSEPVYVEIPTLRRNYTEALIDWSDSFILNGQLQAYIVLADDQLVFRGVSTFHRQEMTSLGQIILFKIKCHTMTGEVETPEIVFDPNAVANIGTTPTSTEKVPTVAKAVYEELWFIVLMFLIGLLLLFLLFALSLQCSSRRRPFMRERLPVRPSEKRARPLVYYTDPIDNGTSGTISSRQRSRSSKPTSYNDDLGPGLGVVNPAFTGEILRDTSIDKVSALFRSDDYLWDKNNDSGLFDEDLSSLESPSFSSITREQTVFTDTHL